MSESKEFGIISMIFGILSIVLFVIPFLGLPLGILAIVFSLVQKRKVHTGPATAGLVTGIIGTILNAMAFALLAYCLFNI